ncbi:hypothetical protein GME04_22155, partial [Parabacteroides merdae]|nr:hypothetical protein [Parabacteroides merdae]
DIIRNFVNELPDSFTTDEAIQIGAKYDFNLRKVTRLLKSLNGIKISKVSHGSYTKMNKNSHICLFVLLSFWRVGKTSGDLKKTSQ